MANKVKPIKPGEIGKKKEANIPDVVFEVFNELLTKNYSGRSATIRQEVVVKLLVEKGLKRNEIFDRGWLDIENVYRKAGWKVIYDKPA